MGATSSPLEWSPFAFRLLRQANQKMMAQNASGSQTLTLRGSNPRMLHLRTHNKTKYTCPRCATGQGDILFLETRRLASLLPGPVCAAIILAMFGHSVTSGFRGHPQPHARSWQNWHTFLDGICLNTQAVSTASLHPLQATLYWTPPEPDRCGYCFRHRFSRGDTSTLSPFSESVARHFVVLTCITYLALEGHQVTPDTHHRHNASASSVFLPLRFALCANSFPPVHDARVMCLTQWRLRDPTILLDIRCFRKICPA